LPAAPVASFLLSHPPPPLPPSLSPSFPPSFPLSLQAPSLQASKCRRSSTGPSLPPPLPRSPTSPVPPAWIMKRRRAGGRAGRRAGGRATSSTKAVHAVRLPPWPLPPPLLPSSLSRTPRSLVTTGRCAVKRRGKREGGKEGGKRERREGSKEGRHCHQGFCRRPPLSVSYAPRPLPPPPPLPPSPPPSLPPSLLTSSILPSSPPLFFHLPPILPY
jgi:hypothetical protein